MRTPPPDRRLRKHSYEPGDLFHVRLLPVSKKSPPLLTIRPGIPRTPHPDEDVTIKRVSLAQTPGEGLAAIEAWNLAHKRLKVHVYTNTGPVDGRLPPMTLVPDARQTGEVWSRSPVPMVRIGVLPERETRELLLEAMFMWRELNSEYRLTVFQALPELGVFMDGVLSSELEVLGWDGVGTLPPGTKITARVKGNPMKTRRNAEDKLRKAERRFKAEPTDEHYRKMAKEALRAGKPLVRFSVTKGGSSREPRDPDGSCVWLAISLSGRAVPADKGVRDDEWLNGHLAQMPASMEGVAKMMADSMSTFEPAQFERWTERPEVNSKLRLSGGDYMARVFEHAEQSSSFTEVYRQAGFTIWHTGGGCTAWTQEAPDGRYILITGPDATCPEADDDEIVVGLYDSDGDWIEEAGGTFPNTLEGTHAAIAVAHRLLGA